MTTAQQYLSALRTYLGVVESPLGSNRTRVGVEFGWNGVAWCAQTVSVALKRAGFTGWWSASTDQMEAWARSGRNGARWLSPGATPRPGDLAIWDYKRDGTANHVNTVEVPLSDGRLQTIGGNESNRCLRAVRSRNYLRGFIRLPFAVSAPAPLPPPPTGSVSHPTLSVGSVGLSVKEYQWKMNATTGSTLPGDGHYGAADLEACKNFQRFFKLTVDGVCGPKTWATLDYVYDLKH
jgi:hypothetical protein